MWLDLSVIAVLCALNAVFALSEMAIVASRKTRLKQMAASSIRAQAALELSEHPSKFLSLTQICITLIGVIAGAYSGASIGARIAPWFDGMPLIGEHSAIVGFLLSAAFITFVTLMFGELAPKRLALINPERIAVFIGAPMLALSKIASPVVTVLARLTDLVVYPFKRMSAQDEQMLVEEEIRHLLTEATQAGQLERQEQHLVERALSLGERDVESIMTPRTRVTWLDLEVPFAENLSQIRATGYTSYPVCQGDIDDIVGTLSVPDLVGLEPEVLERDFKKFVREPVYSPASGRIFPLLRQLNARHLRLAIVVDEYGAVVGVVTAADIYKALLGFQPDPNKPDDPPVLERADGSLLVDGALPLADLRELLHLSALPGEDEQDFNTLAGFLIAQIGRLPDLGEVIEAVDRRFEIVDRDHQRIDKVLISRASPIEAGDTASLIDYAPHQDGRRSTVD
jgi:putative hemolysin